MNHNLIAEINMKQKKLDSLECDNL